jgi:pSer/pThr/pTyr-binding forkhead associated (FHA) protein
MSSGQFQATASPVETDDAVNQYWVRFGTGELPLQAGETLIGRAEACDIIVSEGLVSRRHARIVLDGGRPYIEDLGSSNGTFVNQARLHGRALLFPGDTVFIGTCEIELILRVDENRPTTPVLDPYDALDRPTPASGVSVFEPVRSEPAPSSQSRASRSRLDTDPPNDATLEAETFEYVGRLADKMFTLGRVDAAQKLLEGHLSGLLQSTRSGRVPSGPLVDAAGRYAVKLAGETLSGRWVDVAIELHLVACRPLREETIQQLAALRAKAPIGSEALLLRYHERLRGNLALMNGADRVLCERVACLLPGLDTER